MKFVEKLLKKYRGNIQISGSPNAPLYSLHKRYPILITFSGSKTCLVVCNRAQHIYKIMLKYEKNWVLRSNILVLEYIWNWKRKKLHQITSMRDCHESITS